MNITVTGIGAVLPPAGETLTDFALTNYPVSPKTYLDRASALALAACGLALQDAGLSGTFDVDFGLSTGTQFGCVATMQGFETALHDKGARGASPLLFSHSYFNSPASLIAIEWGLKGAHLPLCGTNSGWAAVEAARDALLLGHAKRMLCGAFEAKSQARSWYGETNPQEGALFFVLEADGDGPSWEKVFSETARDVEGDWGALGDLLRHWHGWHS